MGMCAPNARSLQCFERLPPHSCRGFLGKPNDGRDLYNQQNIKYHGGGTLTKNNSTDNRDLSDLSTKGVGHDRGFQWI